MPDPAVPTPADMPWPGAQLALLALANFTIGMGAFVVIGVLSPIATAFGIDRAQAGWVMTAYAAVYAVSSPVVVAATGRIERRRLMLIGLGVFALGALLCMLSSRFEALLAGRAVMALGGGIVTPVAASIGVALAGVQRQGRALALVFGGLTLAQVLGVPAGAWIGYAFGWQSAFAAVVALALLAVLALGLRLPGGIAVPAASLATLGKVLGDLKLMTAVSLTAWFIGGLYVVYTYLAPFLEARWGLARDGVTTMLLIFGAGAVIGNAVGGRLTDRIGPLRTLVGLCLAQLVVMPLLTLVPWGLVAVGIMIGAWSICSWSFMVPQQARLARMSPAQIPVLFALNAAAIYVGASVGSAVGGTTLRLAGMSWLGPVGAVLALLALISLLLVRRWSSSGRAGPVLI